MILPNAIKTMLISHLKADTAIAAYLTARNGDADEVREINWHGRNFLLPGIRVDGGTSSPFENGPCYPNRTNLSFRVYTISEQDSSFECGELAGLVHNSLFNKRLSGSGFTTTLVLVDSLPVPVWTGENTWQAIEAFRCQVNGGLS